MRDYISGIQQIGIGVKNAHASMHQYAKLFGMEALVFNDISEASLMTRYTGGQAFERQALLTLNMQGGGGFEIWQFRTREPTESGIKPAYGDLGIYAAKLKSDNIHVAHQKFRSIETVKTSAIMLDGKGDEHFWVQDAQGNNFDIVRGNQWFQKKKGQVVGGITGAVIGVSNVEKSVAFYKAVLNTDQIIYDSVVSEIDEEGILRKYRKLLLQKNPCGKGAFSKLLGPIQIELIQCLDRTPSKIYANRYWGDCGFIHICFDVFDMCGLKRETESKGYAFTVDSVDSFGMDAAAGRFCYMEDPDGTLIELVETHRVPIVKKWGIYLNLKKRDLEKPLPDWMIKLLALSKVK